MLRHRDGVAESDFCHSDVAITSCSKIDMIASNTCREGHFQFGCFCNSFGCQIRRPEWLRNNNFSIVKVLFQHGVGSILGGSHDKFMATVLQEFPKPQLTTDTSEQRTGLEAWF